MGWKFLNLKKKLRNSQSRQFVKTHPRVLQRFFPTALMSRRSVVWLEVSVGFKNSVLSNRGSAKSGEDLDSFPVSCHLVAASFVCSGNLNLGSFVTFIYLASPAVLTKWQHTKENTPSGLCSRESALWVQRVCRVALQCPPCGSEVPFGLWSTTLGTVPVHLSKMQNLK